jgi:hypothetical protein
LRAASVLRSTRTMNWILRSWFSSPVLGHFDKISRSISWLMVSHSLLQISDAVDRGTGCDLQRVTLNERIIIPVGSENMQYFWARRVRPFGFSPSVKPGVECPNGHAASLEWAKAAFGRVRVMEGNPKFRRYTAGHDRRGEARPAVMTRWGFLRYAAQPTRARKQTKRLAG